MTRFIAVHTAPFTKENLTQFRQLPLPENVHWNLTYCDFADGKFFCEWEAPNREDIGKLLKDNDVPFDAIYPVRLFNVASGVLED